MSAVQGSRLREARQAAGVTLTAMAAATCYSKGYLSNIELGRRPVPPEVLLAYERELADMDRRSVLTGLAATALAPAAVGELLHRGFTAALGKRPDTERWLDRTATYGTRYMQLGAAEMQTALAGDLVVLQQQLEQPQLWAVAARLMTVYGKTLPSNTGGAGAIRWYRIASVLADRSGDDATRVWVRGRTALALAYEGASLSVARDLADAALAIDDRATLGRLNALVASAHIAGWRGDGAAARRLLDDARRVFDVAGSAEQISDFAVPAWRFSTFASMLLSRLGDPTAEREQGAADAQRPATLPRFATHIELHRALMLARAGDRAGGRAYARTALDRLPVEKRSLSLRLMAAEIDRVAGAAPRTN
ncbi:hypothetical protein GCM10010123_22620 [Pilimelia anulata]|uniref:HTH cro/C1-type domain-containing protein n=1 Tax=Pilimelia anulata TaxID=53371 RepID=A0A8J3B333_9ACTN|nr:helix-turn-helix transcriptional regulator [Pilimelia anulata]GGJ92274.1 hypothetical protein GCM10010123_22620 [Pilimelia anulata]